MSRVDRSFNLFRHGSTWVRMDFHLHTKADKEFSYSADNNAFVESYVQALQSSEVRIGVITNHNKFDRDEFQALSKKALKGEVFLLPGVELSVNDGANGIHTLVVFSNQWIENGQDYINQFLNIAFEGKTPDQYEHENGRSSLGLIDTIKKLEGYHRDFFIVFAHVEEKRGLWHELDGGRIEELGKDETFRRRSLAFQKVRTHDVKDRKCRTKVQGWLKNSYPAEVEGSDCKSLEQVGKGSACFLKLGDFTFEAVKYALLDCGNRVAGAPPKHERSHILTVSFEGGVLDRKSLDFSPELNTLIGIRGSGKSSVLEALRYAMDIPFGEKALDTEYKERLVDHVLGSGGKVTVYAEDRRGKKYEVRRIYKEKPDVYVDGIMQPGISIRETVLHKPIYFGQKDLSSTGDGFEKDLVEKLIGENLADVRSDINAQSKKVIDIIKQLSNLSKTDEDKKIYESKKQDAEFRLKFYKDYGVEERLQKQVGFDADSRACDQVVSLVRRYLSELEDYIKRHKDALFSQSQYKSTQNQTFFEEFFSIYNELIISFSQIEKALVDGNRTLSELKNKAKEFNIFQESLKEEFAEIERKLAEELKNSGTSTIRSDEFRKLHETIEQSKKQLEALSKQENHRSILQTGLLKELAKLNELWHREFRESQEQLDIINKRHSSLQIRSEFKADKDAFVVFMKNVFRGSGIRGTSLSMITEEFTDCVAVYKEFDKAREITGGSAQVFEEYFKKNLADVLTWQVPNRFIIEYRGKELKHHSLGQRASALIMFVLNQHENDVIIIDQPEDDLDNQTIYEDVIKLIRSIKPDVQFIFATHNANFPVLGDAEQIIACSYSDDAVSETSGSIDRSDIQQEIVSIMEGGEEAFRRRKRIYEIWKPLP